MALDDLMEFPSPYTIKVLGAADPDFADVVFKAIKHHAGDSTQQPDVRSSKKANFLSVNVTFTATGVKQLEDIHQSLNDTGRVKYIL